MTKQISKKSGLKPSERVETEKNSNQWTANPKQQKWLDLYLNPRNKKTFGNAYQSGIAAGYSHAYSRIIASDHISNNWIAEGKAAMRQFTPDHIIQGIQREATDYSSNRGSERLKAFELLAKMQGLLVDRSITAHVNVEQALSELK